MISNKYEYITKYKNYDILKNKYNDIYSISKNNKILYTYFESVERCKYFINEIL